MYTSRPVNCSAVYGLRPATGSVTDFWNASGTISTRPPTDITRMTRTISRPWLRSIMSCVSIVQLLGVRGGRHGNRRIFRAGRAYGLHYVVEHDQHPGEVEQPAQKPDRV